MGAFRSKDFKGSLALAAALFFGLIASVAPAQAQFFGSWGYRRMEPPPQMMAEAVVQRLSRSGFKVLQIRPNGGVFLVDARDQSARLTRLVVDARDGAILQRYAMADPRGGVTDGGAFAPAPGFAPPAPGDASSVAKPRPATPRVKPAPSEATVAPAPEQVPPPVATTAAAPPMVPAPMVGPGYANGVPINPLD